MKRYLLFLLVGAINLFSNVTGENYEEDLPPDYVQEPLPDLDEFDYYDELTPKGGIPADSEETASRVMATLEGLPSAVVAGCVNHISGDFFDSQIDLVAPGPTPIVVQRSWCSSDKKWHFGHMPELKVGRSRGENHIKAGYSDDSGMGLLYKTYLDGKNEHIDLIIPPKVFDKGLTNCGAGEISGQTNWLNSRLVFVRRDDEKMYLLRHPSRTDRIFSYVKNGLHHRAGAPSGKFRLEEE